MLKVLSATQAEEWDSIVRSFNNYDTYWLNGYSRAFQIHGDGDPLLFYYERNNTRGINVVMKRDVALDSRFSGLIPENMYYDFSSPYGYGGWLIEGDETAALFKDYENWVKKNGIISEFVRFHPVIKNHEKVSDLYVIVKLGEVVHMDLASPGIIWSNLTSKNRNMIRKAIKNGVKIYNGRYPQVYETFRNIYNNTMREDSADPYYYFSQDFYQSLLNDLPYNSQVFFAVKKGLVIASSVILMANGYMNYHLSGNDKQFNTYAPTNLLLYEAALWGCFNGYKSFYLGGGLGSGNDSLFKFKKAFNRGELNHFFIGKKIFDQQKYDMLVKLRNKDIIDGYFPQYRA